MPKRRYTRLSLSFPFCLNLEINVKKESRNQHEAGKFEIKTLEARTLGLKGKYREEAMAAYRKLLGTSRDKPVYFARY